jgi:hypothetical protein
LEPKPLTSFKETCRAGGLPHELHPLARRAKRIPRSGVELNCL